MGLDENNTITDVIMCQLKCGRYVNEAQVPDLEGINYLY